MALDCGKIKDLIQLYAGQAGVDKTSMNPTLVREVMNIKLREFLRETGILTSKWTISSVASQMEYELPAVLHVTKCNFDGSKAIKSTHPVVDEVAGNVS